MTKVKIIGLTMVDERPNRAGSRIVAFFNCEVNGFRLLGCALAITEKHGLTVWPPKIDGPNQYRSLVQIENDLLRNAMIKAAKTAYLAIAGTSADPVGPAPSLPGYTETHGVVAL